jgi:hypothetical protein
LTFGSIDNGTSASSITACGTEPRRSGVVARVVVEEPHLQVVGDVLNAVDALGGVRPLALLREAADRAAQHHVALVGRDGDRLVVDAGLPEELLLDVVAQVVIGHDVLVC